MNNNLVIFLVTPRRDVIGDIVRIRGFSLVKDYHWPKYTKIWFQLKVSVFSMIKRILIFPYIYIYIDIYIYIWIYTCIHTYIYIYDFLWFTMCFCKSWPPSPAATDVHGRPKPRHRLGAWAAWGIRRFARGPVTWHGPRGQWGCGGEFLRGFPDGFQITRENPIKMEIYRGFHTWGYP